MLVIIYNLYFLGEPMEVDIRSTGQCPSGYTYSNVWKPKTCPIWGFAIRREHVRKVNKPKLDTDSPKCVLVVESFQLKLFSVEIKSKHNRVFVCSQAQILFVTPKMQQKEGSSCC